MKQSLILYYTYADDTNIIFIIAASKEDALRKANLILKEVFNYMKCNLLHINMSKCCYSAIHYPQSKTYQ